MLRVFAGVWQLAEEYRQRNGLDPHITPANAALQIPRVARARALSEEVVRRLVADHIEGRR